MRRLLFLLFAAAGLAGLACGAPAGAPCDSAGQCAPGLYCNAAAAACVACDAEHSDTPECR